MTTRSIFIFLVMFVMIACQTDHTTMTIDLSTSWRFSPDGQNLGLSEEWHSPDFDDSRWAVIDAGIRWEDQGYEEVDSLAWYRKVIDIPSDWQNDYVWLILGGVNDAYTLFVNGHKVNVYGNQHTMTMAFSTTVTEVSRYINFGGSNLIAIQVNDWGSSGGLWHLPVKLSRDKSEVENLPILTTFPMYGINQIWVNFNTSCMGNASRGDKIRIKIRDQQNASIVTEYAAQLEGENTVVLSKIPVPKEQLNKNYLVTADITDDHDKILLSLSKEITWNPQPPGPAANGERQLNNFVDELVHTDTQTQNDTDFSFSNSRDSWIFFSVKVTSQNASSPQATLDNNSKSLVFRKNPGSGAFEAMQFLEAGEHVLTMKKGVSGEVIVRRIPEIIYSDHPSSPHITPYGKYDWHYLTKHVLSNVNTIVTSAGSLAETELDQWKKEGRRWIVHSSLPGLGKKQPATPEEVYAVWSKSPGTTDPRFGGIIVDEFLAGANADHYLAWTNALTSLYQNPDFSNKVFYAYCNDIFYAPNAPAIPFGKKLFELKGKFALERYLPEQPTEAEAFVLLSDELTYAYKNTKRNLPGSENHAIITLGYLTDPTETLSRYPNVDYRVFMDMQFHLLATDPTFHDLYGIQEYLSSYADEELLRWAHRLFRHYCIEGNRTRFTHDPYILSHLKNPDFAEGLEDWSIKPAEKGSIEPKSMPGYSWLQGRYPRSFYGDHFVRFKRSAKKPNRIHQTVQNLEPGRLYSLKLIAADLNNLDQKQNLALSIDLEQVDIVKDYSFRFVYPSNYSHKLGPYNRENPAWFNFYRIVFRPKGKAAELVISDWSSPTHSKGPAGQEIVCNFIEIQPFYEK